MAFWKRLWDVLRGKAHAAIESIEDPEQALDVSIRDMTGQVAEFRKKVAAALVDQKRLVSEFETRVTKHEEWTRRAEAAVRGGDDDLARTALTRQTDEESEAKVRYAAMMQHNQVVVHLKDSLRDLTQKLEEAKRRRNLLVARIRSAEATKSMASAMGAGDSGGGFARFHELEQKVDTLEAEATVALEMMGEFDDLGDRKLEARFKALSAADPAVEDSLRKLKERVLLGSRKPAELGPAPPDAALPDEPERGSQ